MNVAEFLQTESMASARLVVQGKGFFSEVSGINILEAPDIALWGRQGMVLLSSYFALSNLGKDDLEAFFTIVEEIGISALAIKLQRLIDEIPPQIISICERRQITLIQLGRSADYQAILLDVFRPLIERTEEQLMLHYRLSNISSQLSLSSAATLEILERFNQFLHLDLTLLESVSDRVVSTDPTRAYTLALNHPLPVPRSEYMNFRYRRFRTESEPGTPGQGSALVIDISCVEDREHTLIVHENPDHQVQSTDIVIVENLIRSLQTRILQRQAVQHQQQMNRNALVGDLLTGKLTNQGIRVEALASLGLNRQTPSRVFTIYLSLSQADSPLFSTGLMNRLTRLLRGFFPGSVHYLSANRVQAVLTGPDLDFDQDLTNRIAESINRMLEEESRAEDVRFVGGLSDIGPADSLHVLEHQSRSTAQLMLRHGKWGTMAMFDTLGPLKLFMLANQNDLTKFVPAPVLEMYHRDRSAYDTLRLYMQRNLSHTAAADELSVHPKTVRYRIANLERELGMNFRDPQTQSILLMSFEILEFTEGVPLTNANGITTA